MPNLVILMTYMQNTGYHWFKKLCIELDKNKDYSLRLERKKNC